MRTFVQGDRIRYQRSHPNRPFLLQDAPIVYGVGPDSQNIRIAIFGEAPGSDESRTQEPFVGQAGRYLTWGLGQAGIYRPGCYLSNVIDRQPPANNIQSVEAKDAIEAQKEAFLEELRWLHERGVRVILAVGSTAKDAFGIEGSITKTRGSVYEYNLDWPGVVVDPAGEPSHFVVIPVYHPSYLMRARWTGTGNDRADNALTWIGDLKKAKEIADRGWQRPVERFAIQPTVDQVVEFVENALTGNRLIAIDIETAGFNPKNDSIVCVGMATSAEDAICIPFYHTGRRPNGDLYTPHTPYWNPADRKVVEHAIRRVLKEGRQLYQNSLFDVNYLQEAGYEVDVAKVEHDTMLLHHAVNPELPHNLGFITSVYGHTPYWKEDFLHRDTTIWEMEERALGLYNARDCVVLHQVLQPLLDDLRDTGTDAAYRESLSLVGPVLEMMQTGLKLDQNRLRTFREEVARDIDQVERDLRSLGDLPEGFNLGSDDDLRLFLFGVQSSKYQAAADWEKHKVGTKVREQKRLLHEVSVLTKCPVPHNYGGRKTKSGNALSVAEESRVGLQIHLQNRLETLRNLKRPTSDHDEEQAGIERLIKWLDMYNRWAELRKLESTYTDFPVRPDGRVHTRYLIHGTVTGRLSSREPNLQNLPKHESRVRRCFVAPRGSIIVSADYNSLEFGTVAYETREPRMIEAFESGISQHDVNTRALFDLDRDDEQWDAARRAAKIYQFATQYGGSIRHVYEKIVQEVPQLNLTWAKFQEQVDNLYRELSTYAAWRERVQEEARQTRKIWNAFGRCRRLYGPDKDIGKEALNFPCQSAAAHIINVATVGIYRRFHESGMVARLQAQTHDQLYVECPEAELTEVVRIMREEMEQPFQFHERVVRFPVGFEVGYSWGELEPYEE